eukprot:TRINITY_DN6469_c0_g1_i1.p2 TRINITY_DN6469_c0_g1~~TRINITY_DN6469_c0_g1_i1.p2  ORF type:complete len:341 (+),score=70.74 TRINITY_DN6469_c0_g1_i1:93-1025(+)
MGASWCCSASAGAVAHAVDQAGGLRAPPAPPRAALAHFAYSAMRSLARRRRPQGPRFEGDNQDIALYLTRNANQNIVVYEAQWADPATRAALHPQRPLAVYWLSIDPEYRARRASRGVHTDRVELNLIERQAFGVSLTPLPDHPTHGATWGLMLNGAASLTGRRMRLYRDARTGQAVVETEMGRMMEPCRVRHIHAFARKALAGWRVAAVDMHGVHAVTGRELAERVKGPGEPGCVPEGCLRGASVASNSDSGTPLASPAFANGSLDVSPLIPFCGHQGAAVGRPFVSGSSFAGDIPLPTPWSSPRTSRS